MSFHDLMQIYFGKDNRPTARNFVEVYAEEIEDLGISMEDAMNLAREEIAVVICLYCFENNRNLPLTLQ